MRKDFLIFVLFLMIAGCRTDSDITSPDDGLPPAVPTGVRITFANDGEIVLRWNQNTEPDFNTYHIYRSTDLVNYTKISSQLTEYYLDDSLEYDITYYYKLSAEDNSGRESALSSEVFATPVNAFPPDTPENININARNHQDDLSVYLWWDPGYESDIIGYNIYRSTEESFTADTSTLIGFTPVNSFSDTLNLQFYKTYYYIVRGVDRGLLIGKESSKVNDMILEIPDVFYPPDNAVITPFSEFIFYAADVPASYKIVVQTNEFFGEFWTADLATDVTNDTLKIPFTPTFLERNKTYYWRIAAFTRETGPNSVSKLFSFTIKPE